MATTYIDSLSDQDKISGFMASGSGGWVSHLTQKAKGEKYILDLHLFQVLPPFRI